MKKRLLPCLLLCALLLTACGAQKPAQPEPAKLDPVPLTEVSLAGDALQTAYTVTDNARVFYEIFVGSFSDSNGDGIGDLRGIINRFDYLNDGQPNSGRSLGVEGLWLTPIFASPSYHKYDVTDYYQVDPAFGSMEDLEELIALCHARNVKLILDLPINHTGSQNQWFLNFVAAHQAGDEQDPFFSYYSFCHKDAVPNGTFAPIPGTDSLYECNFSQDMPELNFDYQPLREELLRLAQFYLDLGVDGFRFDAAKYIYFGDNGRSEDFWLWYTGKLRESKPDVYLVAEVWDSDLTTDIYYPAMNCFDFTMSQAEGQIAKAARGGNVNRYTAYVQEYLDRVKALREDAMILPFIANHDMDRAAGFLSLENGAMRMAANLYLLSPGSPFIYYGEELGMRGSRGGSNTDANRRLAMNWGDGDTVRDPEGSSYSRSGEVSALEQMADPDSLYNYYKELLMLRAANPEIARGDYTALSLEGSNVGGFVSSLDGPRVCVLHNTTGEAMKLKLPEGFSQLSAWIGAGEAALEDGVLTIPAQTSVILR